jgi:hypothetical protein
MFFSNIIRSVKLTTGKIRVALPIVIYEHPPVRTYADTRLVATCVQEAQRNMENCAVYLQLQDGTEILMPLVVRLLGSENDPFKTSTRHTKLAYFEHMWNYTAFPESRKSVKSSPALFEEDIQMIGYPAENSDSWLLRRDAPVVLFAPALPPTDDIPYCTLGKGIRLRDGLWEAYRTLPKLIDRILETKMTVSFTNGPSSRPPTEDREEDEEHRSLQSRRI